MCVCVILRLGLWGVTLNFSLARIGDTTAARVIFPVGVGVGVGRGGVGSLHAWSVGVSAGVSHAESPSQNIHTILRGVAMGFGR